MRFFENQKVTVICNNKLTKIDIITRIDGDRIYLSNGQEFDKHGRSIANTLWDITYIDEYQEEDEKALGEK